MENKYELTDETIEYLGHTLHRIKALKDFGDIKKGDLGGFVEKEANLSQNKDCWVSDKAMVYGDAIVYGNARIYGNAKVFGNALVYGNASISEYAKIFGKAFVHGSANVCGKAQIYGSAKVCGKAKIYDNALIYGNSEIYGDARVYGNAIICAEAEVFDKAWVYDKSIVHGHSIVCDKAEIFGNAEIDGNTIVKHVSDYIVFKNNWSSGRYFTWTKSNNMWRVGCFYGTGEELIKKAYEDSYIKGENYKATVNYVKTILNNNKVLWK